MSSVLMQKGFQHCLPGQFNEEERNNLNKTKTSIYKTVFSLSFPGVPSPSTRLQWGSPSMVHPGVVWPHFHQHQGGVVHYVIRFTNSVKLGRMPRMLEDTIRSKCDLDRLRDLCANSVRTQVRDCGRWRTTA